MALYASSLTQFEKFLQWQLLLLKTQKLLMWLKWKQTIHLPDHKFQNSDCSLHIGVSGC